MAQLQKSIAAWFTWEEDPDKAEMEISLLVDEDILHIQDASSTDRQVFDPVAKTIKNESTFSRAIDRQETALRILKTRNWDKMYDSDRKPMECTEENIRTWACNNGFMAFLNRCQKQLKEQARLAEEAAGKN